MKSVFAIVAVAVVAALSLLLAVPAASASAEAMILPSGLTDAQAVERLDAFLTEHSANHAAVATAVFRGNDDVYTRYFGYIDAAATIPLDDQCVLEWGSTSKLLVWVCAMQLVQAGRLDLSRDIRAYLPQGFLTTLRYDEPITFLHLMNHNAGFQETDFVLEVTDARDVLSLGDYLATYQPLQVFRPGEVVAYSNWGAALAGYVVECIAGVPYYQYVADNVFAPLGMRHSALAPDLSDNAWVQARRETFVSYLPDGTLEPDNKCYIIPYPAGMCTSTLSDFILFAKALLTRDERLLSADGFDALFSPSLVYTGTDTPRLYHGFLVDYEFAVPIVGHDGNTMGGSSRLLLDFRDNVGMVVLTNQLGGSLYRSQMTTLVFGESEHHVSVDGYYMPARTIWEGKSLFLCNFLAIDHLHITPTITDGLYINVVSDRFEISTCDYLAISPAQYRLMDAVAIIWFILLAYALLNMLARAVVAILSARRKLPLDCLNLLNIGYSLMLVLSVLALLPSVPGWAVLVYTVVLGLCGVALGVYLILRRRAYFTAKWPRLSFWQTVSLSAVLVFTVINVCVWDLALLL